MRAVLTTVLVLSAAIAAAQPAADSDAPPADPRIVIGGEIFVTAGSDDPGFFNYTDYEYSALRNLRFSIATELRASSYVQALAEVRLDHGDALSAYALFVRVRPFPARRFDIQIGRLPPAFGAFTRTIYAYDNLVVGQPLAYQYLLSIRPAGVPLDADDVLRMRGRGWLSSFGAGDTAPAPGVPIVNTARYDTGVQVHGVAGAFEWTTGVTTGSLSDPRIGDNNGAFQVAARGIVQAGPAVRIGVSGARGAWMDRAVDAAAPASPRSDALHQQAVAADVEVSSGRWLARAEWLRSRWDIPLAATGGAVHLDATALTTEARYRVWPGLSVAARAEGLWFSPLAGTTTTVPWEADVRRVETAVTYALRRNINAKLAWQMHWRDGGRVRRDGLGAAQLVYWF